MPSSMKSPTQVRQARCVAWQIGKDSNGQPVLHHVCTCPQLDGDYTIFVRCLAWMSPPVTRVSR